MAWTKAQQIAIDKRAADILVSAAAGSGKTAVLTERVLKRILGNETESGIDIDKFLIVTFTSAAANEMKERIGDKLSEAIEGLQKEADQVAVAEKIAYLEKQLALLPKASISTIHSFCLKVIRNYFQALGIDPNIKVGNQAELTLMQYEIIEEIFEERFEAEDNSRFLQVVQTFASIRGIEPLVELVLEIATFSKSTIFPHLWLDEKVRMLKAPYERLEETPWAKFILEELKCSVRDIYGISCEARKLCDLGEGPAIYTEVLEKDRVQLERVLATSSYEAFAEALKAVVFERLSSKKSDCDVVLKEKAKGYRDTVKKTVQELQKQLQNLQDSKLLENIQYTGENLEIVVELVKAFDLAYAEKKKEKGVLDYSDLEHMCLKLLIEPVIEEDELVAINYTDIAKELSGFYREVYIDEYQDSNMVQETMLGAVAEAATDGATRFMVGDMKQSIYRFRLANPAIFADKYTRWYKYIQNGEVVENLEEKEVAIDLSQNFRSRENILAATNDLFEQLMSVEAGELVYDDAARLKVGNPYTDGMTDDLKPCIADAVEVHLYDKSYSNKEGEEEDEESVEAKDIVLEVQMTAEIIERLLNGEGNPTHVLDKKLGQYRKVEPRDIVILLRATTEKANVFENALLERGIGAYAEVGSDFFAAPEIRTMIQFLKILDNPMQDIAFLGVLRSPIVGASYDEIVKIRQYGKERSFYEAFRLYLESEEAEPVLQAFLEQLLAYRQEVAMLPVADLLAKVFTETGYWQYIGMLPRGLQKQANLKMLQKYAADFESGTGTGLFSFLLYLESIQKRKAKVEEAKLSGEGENLVKIMSIHKSKGLEFPVVILSNSAKRFNKEDTKGMVLMDHQLGFGLKHLEEDVLYDTLPFLAIKNKTINENISEEMRIFYVALTRAKEKLFITGVVNSLEKSVKEWSKFGLRAQKEIVPLGVKKSPSYLNWVGMGLFALKDFSDFRDLVGDEDSYLFEGTSKWEVYRHGGDVMAEQKEKEATATSAMEQLVNWDSEITYGEHKAIIEERLTYTYPYGYATTLPTKIAVSDLKKQAELVEMKKRQQGGKAVGPTPPSFIRQEEAQIVGARRGTIIHSIFEHLDLTKYTTQEAIVEQLGRLITQGKIVPEAKEVVDINTLVALANSAIFNRMRAVAHVYREQPFVCFVPASILGEDYPEEEEILLQGVIDTFFIEEDGIVLIDYKTDYVDPKDVAGSIERIKARYSMQLNSYAEALSKITKAPVKEKWIYLYGINQWLFITH